MPDPESHCTLSILTCVFRTLPLGNKIKITNIKPLTIVTAYFLYTQCRHASADSDQCPILTTLVRFFVSSNLEELLPREHYQASALLQCWLPIYKMGSRLTAEIINSFHIYALTFQRTSIHSHRYGTYWNVARPPSSAADQSCKSLL